MKQYKYIVIRNYKISKTAINKIRLTAQFLYLEGSPLLSANHSKAKLKDIPGYILCSFIHMHKQ